MIRKTNDVVFHSVIFAYYAKVLMTETTFLKNMDIQINHLGV